MEDPFRVAAGGITPGAEVTGRVTKILEFGAFVEVAPGVEGLVHISELSWRRVATVDSVLKQDQVIAVKVLEVDEGKRRISLSLKQMTEQPAPEPRPGARGGGRGDRGERDTRTPEEILKETPELRRMREEFKKKAKGEGLKSGLGGGPGVDLGKGLGSLRLGG
jgi:small subunit ribosomal protein S1